MKRREFEGREWDEGREGQREVGEERVSKVMGNKRRREGNN